MVKVWIDQDLCTGDGLCAEIFTSVFEMHDDGMAYVKEADWPNIYGPRTASAVTLYQRRTGLVPDGITGPITLSSLIGAAL